MIGKLTRTIVRTFAFALTLCATSGAWAATPIAEWTDFRNLTSQGYTWTVNSSCTIDPNTGVLTIGESGGLYISREGFGDDDKTLTIAIDAEIPTTFADDRTIVDILLNGNNRVSVAVNGTTMGQCWNGGTVSDTTYGKGTFPSGRQLFIVKYKGGTGTTTCYNKNQYIGNNGTLQASTGKVWLLGVGCYNSANSNSGISEVAEGMKIYSIRLYGSRITEADVTADYDNYYPANSYLTLSGTDASWSTAEWNNTSAPKSASYITVTENTSLNVDAVVSVEKVFFNVANGKTLTLTGASSITASSGIYINSGTIAVANEGVLNLTTKNLELYGAITKESSSSVLTVTGYISGTGTTTMLTLADGATLKPKSSAGGLTVTESLTLSGSINIDLSEVNLSDKADGTYFPILTAPASGEFNLSNVFLTRGANSIYWVPYSRETATEGVYELGVYLTPEVTWSGASGTWTDTSFNGGTDNYTTGQPVVFSDSGASNDPLAITVSGAKTVIALGFTADNRDVTLSGDAISAGTVTKAGDGIATVNNALSVTTSISVTDGVLVLNPTAEVVADEWTASDNGTLVVYVDSGNTTTISIPITATKLIKRGAGTLDLTAISPSIPMVIDAGKVVADDTPTGKVTINENGTFELKDCGWTGSGNVFAGTGVLYLNATSGYNFDSYNKIDHAVTGSTFAGILKISVPSGKTAYFNNNPEQQLKGRPSLVLECGTEQSQGNLWVGAPASSKNFNVKNLSGWANVVPWSNVAGTHYFNTVQTDDTIFSGSFKDWNGSGVGSGNFKTGLTVKGDSVLKSLSLIAANDTTGPLEIQNNGKVIFSISGSWLNGMTTVKEGGVLESQRDAQVVGNLTLEEGSTLSFAEGYSLQVGAITLPASGTVTLDVTALTIPSEGYTLISGVAFTDADCDKFSITAGSGKYYALEPDGTTLKIYPNGASATINGTTTKYSTFTDAFYAFMLSNDATAYVTPFADTPAYSDADLLNVRTALDADGNYYKATVKIGSKGYKSLARAIELAADDDTVVLILNNTESNVTLNDKSVTFVEDTFTFSGSFTGNGTLVLPEGTLLKSAQSSMWLDGWVGTVWVKGINNICGVDTSGSTLFEPNKYGREGSVLKLSGIKGWILGAENPGVTINPTIEIEDATYGYGLWLSDGYGYNGGNNPKNYTILKGLKGTGTLIGDGSGGNVLLQVEGWNDFAGTLTLTNKVVVFGSTLPEEQAHIEGGGYILVKSGESVEVPAGKTWTVGNGVIVNGNLSLGTGAAIVNKTAANTWVKRGTGTITLNAPSDLVGTPDANWIGTVVLKPFDGSSGVKLATYGTSPDATIVVKGMSAGWLDSYGDWVGNYPASRCPATLQLDGAMNITGLSSTWHYIFSKITGTGSISFPSGGSARELTITTLEVPQGTVGVAVTNNTTTTLTINKLVLPVIPACDAKVLAVGGAGEISLDVGNVKVGEASLPAKYKLERRHVGEEDDGFYVYYNGTIFSVY